jgi:hypothetical protein
MGVAVSACVSRLRLDVGKLVRSVSAQKALYCMNTCLCVLFSEVRDAKAYSFFSLLFLGIPLFFAINDFNAEKLSDVEKVEIKYNS